MDNPKDGTTNDKADDPLGARLKQIRDEVCEKSKERVCPWCGGHEWGIGTFSLAINPTGKPDALADLFGGLASALTPVVFLNCKKCGALSLYGITDAQLEATKAGE